MKVWWVLCWNQYYPYSGLANVHSTHASKEEADAAADSLKATGYYDYVEVENVAQMLGAE